MIRYIFMICCKCNMHKMYFCGVCGVLEIIVHTFAINEANLSYHHLHTTYTTEMHAMYNTLEHIK